MMIFLLLGHTRFKIPRMIIKITMVCFSCSMAMQCAWRAVEFFVGINQSNVTVTATVTGGLILQGFPLHSARIQSD
jgi:hypothetical protein